MLYLDAALIKRRVGALGCGKVDGGMVSEDVVWVSSFGEVPPLMPDRVSYRWLNNVDENAHRRVSPRGLGSRGKNDKHSRHF